jgi:hypothetical protein
MLRARHVPRAATLFTRRRGNRARSAVWPIRAPRCDFENDFSTTDASPHLRRRVPARCGRPSFNQIVEQRNITMKHSLWIPTVLSTAILSACGGGGDDSTSTDTGTTPVTPAALTLTGVAATGVAIAGKTVDAKCSAGTGSATSNPDGSYTISVVSGSLPCALKITPDSGTALYSIATGSGSSATANINPVTQLVIASLTGTDPDAYFTSFDSTAAAAVTAAKVSDAVSAVKTTLLAAGLDLGAIDVLAGTLTPATTTTAGNAYDQALDALAAKLTSAGTTLAALTTTVAAASTTATPIISADISGTPSLPADMLLKPAASNCPALRSGTYRVVGPTQALDHQTPLSIQYGKIEVNASTLAIVFTDGSTGSWVPNGPCRFTDADDSSEIVVSPAGVLVARGPNNGSVTVAIGFPEQSHTLAELTGNWSLLGMEDNDADTAYTGTATSATLDAAGLLTSASHCQDDAAWNVSSSCAAVATDGASVKVNSDGGFDWVDGAEVLGRVFAYRAGGGELMLIDIAEDGAFSMWTKQRSNALPAVGRVRTTWDLRLTNLMLATTFGESTNTVTAVDTATNSFTRLAKTVGGSDEHLEAVLVNSPRDGYNFRAAATVTGTDGTTVVNVSEWTNLDLRGMGMNALVRPASKQFMFSVQQP